MSSPEEGLTIWPLVPLRGLVLPIAMIQRGDLTAMVLAPVQQPKSPPAGVTSSTPPIGAPFVTPRRMPIAEPYSLSK